MDKIDIKGVALYPLKQIPVVNGDVFHALKSTDEGYVGFGEAYFSQIASGTVKGWKRHNRVALNLIVPLGAVKFVVYDDRVGSDSFEKFFEVILSAKDNYQRLYVEAGLWVAFAGVDTSTSMLIDIISEPHDPSESDRAEIDKFSYDFKL